MATTPAQKTAHDLLATLPLLSRIMIMELRQNGEETTMPQFRVLTYLSDAPLTVSDIARLRRVSFQSAGELVQALVERGWIERIANPNDRRQSLLHLTNAGREAHERTQEHILERLSQMLENLTPEEQTTVQSAMSLLQRVLVNEERE